MKNEETVKNGQEYWLSLEQFAGDAEFAKRAENEFMSSPFANEDGKDGFARREFLKLMGASIAMASTACVRRPVQHIIPYAQAPKDVIPGIPNFYASSWYDGVEGYGLLVKTLEGRPIKLEGNPLHPMNKGSLTMRGHAEVLSLYDPDRLTGPVRNLQNKDRSNRETISAKWEAIDQGIIEELSKGSVAILSSTLPSPSSRAVIADFLKTFGAGGSRWVQYDSLPVDAVREAQRRSYGRAVLPRYRFDLAKMIVSIDADFLATYLSPAEFMKQWAQFRKPGQGMGRMVSFGSIMTVTSMNADDRFIIKPSQQVDVVLGLVNEVVRASKGAASVPGGASAFLKNYNDVASRLGIAPEMFAKVGAELWANRGRSVVIAGDLATLTPEAVDLQVAVNLLNSILGNDGATIDHSSATLETRQGSGADLATLIADMQAGKVKSLIIHNTNPAFQLPKDAGFLEAIKKVPMVIYTGNRNDETGKLANFVLPAGTTLESWGDYELQSGVYSIQQPTIRPLHDSRSFEESLLAWGSKGTGAPARLTGVTDWHAYVQGIWRTEVFPRAAEGRGKSFDEFWAVVLQQGVVQVGDRERTGSARAFTGGFSSGIANRKPQSGYELALYQSAQIADGRYANVPWLQEMPDPVTKIVWDNYLMVSVATAKKEGLKEGDIVELTLGSGETAKKVKAPVHIQPGAHNEVLALAVGYGRPDAGKVAKGVGVNAFDLVSFNKGQLVFSGQVVSMKKTGEKYELVTTQGHHTMEGRQIVAETTNTAFMQNPGSGIHRHKIFSIWPEHQYTKHKWAMAIDLNTCTGCSACVIACQSENNVPVVGKRYVMQGREMHWLRIDRYYKGSPEAPETVFQPMLCQHCENAPCETVCPVLATVHNDEGINDMVYNRCVGTRYCANNCPYKVRRFNWFNFSKREAPLHMALNPDVTVRSRGVMEKCSFCVHRIRAATNSSTGKKEPGKLVDGSLKTACQQTCPADAIIFGDLNDKESAVAKLFQDQRTYAVLEELTTQPRVRYMSRVRNAERAVADHGHGHAAPAGAGHGEEQHGQQQQQGEH